MTDEVRELIEAAKAAPLAEVPPTCGACGTPAANCDLQCVDAAIISRGIGRLKRAIAAVERVEAPVQQSERPSIRRFWDTLEPHYNEMRSLCDYALALESRLQEAEQYRDSSYIAELEHKIAKLISPGCSSDGPCYVCGRRDAPFTVSQELWAKVQNLPQGENPGILCIACFTCLMESKEIPTNIWRCE